MTAADIRPAIKKAAFPAVLAIISLVLFVAVYWYVTVSTVDNDIAGLIFLIPAVIFGVTALLTATGKMRTTTSAVITAVMIPVLSVSSFICLFVFSMKGTTTDNVSQYERVLKICRYPDYKLINFFPSEIPEDAEGAVFHYHYVWGEEEFFLRYKTSANAVQTYTDRFSDGAIWSGTHRQAKDETGDSGIAGWLNFNRAGYGSPLPDDFLIYLFNNNGNWNHLYISIAAVSTQRNEVIFYAESG